jgi:hypothetical protein
MGFQHHIETAMFDIAYDQNETILAGQSAINDFLKNDLMNVVDEVFNKAGKSGKVFRIPRLEVDLGVVAYHEYAYEMPKRLRERLRAMLDDVVRANRSGNDSNGYLLDKQAADAEELYFFLLHGHLPWYSRRASLGSIEPLLSVAANNPESFRAFLSRVAHQQNVLERLFRQFANDAVMRACRALMPDEYPTLQANVDSLTTGHRSRASAQGLSGVVADRMNALVWQCLIKATLDARDRRVSTQGLFQLALTDVLADRLKIGSEKQRAYVDQLMKAVPADNPLFAILEDLRSKEPGWRKDRRNLNDEAASVPVGRRFGRHRKQSNSESDWLKARLETALRSGDSSVIEVYWSQLLDYHAPMFKTALFEYGQQLAIRQQLAVGFSEEMLLDMLRLIEPSAATFIESTIDRFDLFYAADEPTATRASQRKSALWAYSLGYLLVERGEYFSRQAYIDCLVRQMTSELKQSRFALRSRLRANIDKLPADAQLDAPLAQLARVSETDQGERSARIVINIRVQVEPFRCYQRLRRVLCDRISTAQSSEQSLIEDITRLEQKAPWLLIRIYQELRAGAYALGEQIEQYSVVFIRHLVNTMLSLTLETESAQQPDRVDAVTSKAAVAKNTKDDYLRFLRRITTADSIDFDTIKNTASSERQQDKKSTVRKSREDLHIDARHYSTMPKSGAQAQQLIIDVITHQQELTEATVKQFSVALALMLRLQPSALFPLLESAMADEKFIDSLAANAPDWLQVELLSLLGISHCADMLQCADTLNAACYAEPIAIPPRRAGLIKWKFIHAYMNKTGRLFSRDYFVREYIQALMPHVGLTDLQQLRSILIHRLQSNRLPAIRDISQRLVECLSFDADVIEPAEPAASESPVLDERERDNGLEKVDDLTDDAQIAISNAGVVLAAPYLPRLFAMLDLVHDSAFISPQAAERGVHMLQYLVDETVAKPEYQLVLNKLLCGVMTARPIVRAIKLSERERELLDSLLLGMIQNWKALGNTSIHGLRESFLQRHGTLLLRADAWHLSVEARAFDMLLDQVPWSYSTIKFPWMDRAIYVEWR